ncbi:MAG: sigma 54-interacting transcriptional regulator [Candidatus Adiutrix sp.]|jgi:arginine utilization regulatory protein|nr:sigma 54-interacting transcriptional regulator [Candidatus Adiutrix sp.]
MTKLPPQEIPELDLREALDSLPSGILISDAQGVIVYCNETQSQIDGLSREWIIGRHVTELYVPSPLNSPILTALRTGQPVFDLFEMYETVHGRVVNSIHTVLPLSKNGRVSGCICLVTPADREPEAGEGSRIARNSILFSNLVGSSPAFRQSIDAALSAADSPSSVLIYGETGSGKELLARQLHDHSHRVNQPYVAINCSAIPSTLLEGMLFGSVKGAFTGAQNSPGLFEQAQGGTIYLDEVDSMPLDLQPKLLRVIQERRVRRVGAMEEKDLDIRIISSFSGEPLEAVQAGRVRADLFYRLGVVIINIPPLRERMTDLPGLISFFINKHTAILKKKTSGLTGEAMLILKHHHWPGNVRELENVIEGALNIIPDNGMIDVSHLPHYFRHLIIASPEPSAPGGAAFQPPRPALATPLPSPSAPLDSIGLFKPGRDEIMATMIAARGSITEAARRLGVSRQRLAYRLKKLGLTKEQFAI